MKKSLILAWILATLALAACADIPVDSRPTGSMRMALAATGPDGATYRLRSALFEVSGAAKVSLDSESDPSANVLSTEVPAGDYDVMLNDGWYIEREANGQVGPVNAVLTSVNPQHASLASQGPSDVVFTFDVNNLPVVFSPGKLNVRIEVLACDGSPGQWDGCRGNGCFVCTEKLVGYPRYVENHPGCSANSTCDGAFFTCNDRCPAPTDADR